MGRKLYVGNLPYETGETELQDLFAQYGSVESVRVMRDMATGRARGFAFVEMSTDEEAQAAASNLNEHQIGGRSLAVNEARPKPEYGGGGGGYGGGRNKAVAATAVVGPNRAGRTPSVTFYVLVERRAAATVARRSSNAEPERRTFSSVAVIVAFRPRMQMPPRYQAPPTFAALGLQRDSPTPSPRSATKSRHRCSARSIPLLLEGRDLLGQAATGTGKTAAFALPMLQRIASLVTAAGSPDRRPRARADARAGDAGRRGGAQVRERRRSVGRAALRRRADASADSRARARRSHRRRDAGTRARPHAARDAQLDALAVVVLDEADEMLDMGFADDLDAILKATPDTRQTALFSATMPSRILAIADRHLRNPARITHRAREAGGRQDAARPSGRLHRQPCVQAGRTRAPARHGRSGGDARVLPDAARGRVAGRDAERARTSGRGAARRHDAAAARPRHGTVPGEEGRPAGGDRRRRARARHRTPVTRRELRRPVVAGSLPAPHRPHRSRGTRGHGDHAGRGARAPASARDRAVHEVEDRDGRRCRPWPTFAHASSISRAPRCANNSWPATPITSGS